MNFNHESAKKGLHNKRPNNLRFEPKEGAVWTYFDAEGEGTVEWLIESIDGPNVRLKKLTGKDAGYMGMYELERMDAKRWKPLDATDAVTEVLWACPHCDEAKPIRIGDYVCVDCRNALDIDE